MVSVLRPSQHIHHIPGIGVQTSRPAVASAATGLVDTFTDADGTLLTAHTPDSAPLGATWSSTYANYATPGAFKIASNAAYQSAAGVNVGFAFIETDLADCTITVNLRTINVAGAYGGNGFVFRVIDSANYWYCDIVALTALRIIDVSGGVETLLNSEIHGFTNDTDYQIVLTLNGNSISATSDGVTVSGSSSVRATATKHGVTSVNNAAYKSLVYDIAVAAL